MIIRCGTRSSLLALTQTQLVINALQDKHAPLTVARHEIKTLGDRKQGTAAASQSDKKDWVYDLELALLNQQIDFAVHSSKDIPYQIEPGTALLPVLPRANPHDAFVGRHCADTNQRLLFADLPLGAKVGTASLRRQAFLLRMRPDLKVVEYRGNVPTRLQKLDESDDIMGIVLASAGLERLNQTTLQYQTFLPDEMLPAINQGTLAVQFRSDDTRTRQFLQTLVEPTTQATWLAERAVAEVLKGDCKSAIGIFAACDSDRITLNACVMLPDGSEYLTATGSAPSAQAAELGQRIADRLLAQGAMALIEKSRKLINPNQ
jgi:hydroxymethylbilane synthase